MIELIDQLLEDDLASIDPRLHRHHVTVGTSEEGQEVRISPYGYNLLIAGSSGSGKSTMSTGIIERLTDKHYQCCIIDPEGDYESMEQAVTLGDSDHTPNMHEVIQSLENPDTNLVVNLVGLPIKERPAFFRKMFKELHDYRTRTGRPHWIVLDEVHHLVPAEREVPAAMLTPSPSALLMITVHPDQVAAEALNTIDAIAMTGKTPAETLEAFTRSIGESLPAGPFAPLQPKEALYWNRSARSAPLRVEVLPNRSERRRHRRKYAEGELGSDRSFYFQGPDGRLKLRAQNLMIFLQLAEGIDADTWMFHLRHHDYSTWVRDCIKDPGLAEEIREIEQNDVLGHSQSLTQIKSAVEHHYVLSPHFPSSSSSST